MKEESRRERYNPWLLSHLHTADQSTPAKGCPLNFNPNPHWAAHCLAKAQKRRDGVFIYTLQTSLLEKLCFSGEKTTVLFQT